MNDQHVIHQDAYYLKAMIMDGSHPKIILSSEGYPDAEVTIVEGGKLTFRRAAIEAVEPVTVLAFKDRY